MKKTPLPYQSLYDDPDYDERPKGISPARSFVLTFLILLVLSAVAYVAVDALYWLWDHGLPH